MELKILKDNKLTKGVKETLVPYCREIEGWMVNNDLNCKNYVAYIINKTKDIKELRKHILLVKRLVKYIIIDIGSFLKDIRKYDSFLKELLFYDIDLVDDRGIYPQQMLNDRKKNGLEFGAFMDYFEQNPLDEKDIKKIEYYDVQLITSDMKDYLAEMNTRRKRLFFDVNEIIYPLRFAKLRRSVIHNLYYDKDFARLLAEEEKKYVGKPFSMEYIYVTDKSIMTKINQ